MGRLTHLVLLFTQLAAFITTMATLPADSEPLTPDNFKQTISSGVWLVEYFSPFCGHCQAFAPIWERLVEDTGALPSPGIEFAKVNCAIHGDFCVQMDVKGWPSIHIYKDGQFVDQFRGNRELFLLKEFVDRHRDITAAPPLPVNPDGIVAPLDEKNFRGAVNRGPLFVKFYAPWCGHCRRLAPVWTQLAKRMQHKLAIAEVNCEDHGTLCQSQDVKGYPMLFLYSDGERVEYTGGRTLDKLETFADKVSKPPVQELVLEDFEKHVKNNPVVYLLLHSSSNTKILDNVAKASLRWGPPIYSSSSKEFFDRFLSPGSAWGLFALKDQDPTSVVVRYDADGPPNFNVLREWMVRHSLPTTMELDGDSFKSVMSAEHRPLVVIAASSGEMIGRVEEELRRIGDTWRSKTDKNFNSEDVVFTWMDVQRWESWLKGMYGIKQGEREDGISIVIADHSRLVYWDEDQQGDRIRLSSSSIFSTLEGIKDKSLKYKHSENLIERFARSLNNHITALEAFVMASPLRSAFMFLSFLLLAFLVLKRVLSDGNEANVHSRLD